MGAGELEAALAQPLLHAGGVHDEGARLAEFPQGGGVRLKPVHARPRDRRRG